VGGIVERKRRTLLSVRRALFDVHKGRVHMDAYTYIYTYLLRTLCT